MNFLNHNPKEKIIFKVIAVFVVAIFLWNQIAWAGDIYSDPLTVPTSDSTDYADGMFTPGELEEMNNQQQSVVDTMNAINDFVNPRSFSSYSENTDAAIKYDSLNRIIKKTNDDGSYTKIYYHGTTERKKREDLKTSSNVLIERRVYRNSADNYMYKKIVYDEHDPDGDGIFCEGDLNLNGIKDEGEFGDDVNSDLYGKKVIYFYKNEKLFDNGTPGDVSDDYGRLSRIKNNTDGYNWYFTYSKTNILQVTKRVKKDLSRVVLEKHLFKYDELGRLTEKTFTDVSSEKYEYWEDTTDLSKVEYYSSEGAWENSVHYYEDGETIHQIYTLDPNLQVEGDYTGFEYDELGRVIKGTQDNGDYVLIEYWEDTEIESEVRIYIGGAWQQSIKYYEDGISIKEYYVIDQDPEIDGDITGYEIDGAGRVIKILKDNGDFILLEYWADTENFSKVTWYKDQWQWQETQNFDTDGTTLLTRFILDADKDVDGNVTAYTYDDLGRIIRLYRDDESFVEISYWGETEEKFREVFYATGNIWQETLEYFETPANVVQYRFVFDANPEVGGDITAYTYDELGRVIKEYNDNGHYKLIEYWGETTDKCRDVFYRDGNVWYMTDNYREDGVTISNRWVIDDNPDDVGDITYYRYDLQGRVDMIGFDDFTRIMRSYWTETGAEIKTLTYYSSSWEELKTLEYFEDGITKHFEWLEDLNPGVDGDEIYYEYNEKGRIVRKDIDAGYYWYYVYLDDGKRLNVEVKKDMSHNILENVKHYDNEDNRVWYIEKFDEQAPDVSMMPDDNGKDIFDEMLGKHVIYTFDDDDTGRVRRIDNVTDGYYWWNVYHTDTPLKIFTKEKKNVDHVVLKRYEYDSLGRLMREVNEDGSYITYEEYYSETDQPRYIREYDSTGVCVTNHEYDINGDIVDGNSTTTWISEDLYVSENSSGFVSTYKNISGNFLEETRREDDGVFIVYEYDGFGVETGFTRYNPDGTIEKYDSNCTLIEKRIPDENFIKGINLPWNNYGYDIGEEPGTGYHIGFSSDLVSLYERIRSCQGGYVRLFLFNDLRSGINFDPDGTPISFTDKVFEDMKALLRAAEIYNVKLMPTLFDFSIADGISEENGYTVGEHADLITDPAKKQALLTLFDTFFSEFAQDPNIYAWDIMNEPEHADAVTLPEIKTFISDYVNLIKSISSDTQVTVGSKNRTSMIENWTDLGLDLYQFHYYDSFEGTDSLDYNENNLFLDKPVIAGELEPTDVGGKLDTLYENGYNGGFFWEDDGAYDISLEGYSLINDWFKGEVITYEYYASGRKHYEISSTGTIREFEDISMYEDGSGRLLSENITDAAYKTYEYYDDTTSVRTVSYFLNDDTLFIKEEFDVDGNLAATNYYDENGDLAKVRKKIDELEIFYDAEGKILSVTDGLYEELRKYTIADGEILYTSAIHNGIVKKVVEGYYSGIGIISRVDTGGTEDDVSVTYDNDITIGYSGSEIRSLTVEGGYTNFYSETGILYQTSSTGDLYEFEDNFLKRITTVNGNIYIFQTTEIDGGITVSITEAVIDGVKCEFADSKISAIYMDGQLVDIESFTLLNGPSIGEVVVNVDSVSYNLTEEDPEFMRLQGLLDQMSQDVPNLEFSYTQDMTIRKILTGEYCDIEFIVEDDPATGAVKGDISRTTSVEGVSVDYSFIRDINGIITRLELLEDNAKRIFDATGQLLSIEFEDGKKLDFSEGALSGLETDGSVLDHINFDEAGEIEEAHLIKADGSEYFFVGKTLQEFTDGQDCEFEYDDAGNLLKVTRLDSEEVFNVTYETDPVNGEEITVFISEMTKVEYMFKEINGQTMLTFINDPSGIEVNYQYDDSNVVEQVNISYGGVRTSAYYFEYQGEDEELIITDDLGNKRTYDGEGKAVSLETPYNETYLFAYEVDENGDTVTKINYTYKTDPETGDITEYFKGKIQKITKADGTYIDNIEFDDITGALKRYSFHTVDGKHRNVILQGELVQFELEDSTRLVFHDGKLVAIASSQGIVPLCDLELLKDYMYGDDEERPEEPVVIDDIDVSAASWRHQTYEDSKAIHFVERDYENDQWELNVTLETGDENYSKGEMYFDLRYDIPGLYYQDPIDMIGQEISFLFKPDANFEYDPLWPCNIQVFAKDKDWNTQYGTKVKMEYTGEWIKVSLIPTEDTVNLGYTDPDFDPSSIVMIGLRITEPDNSPAGVDYTGKILLKHEILPDLFANVNHQTDPLDELYVGLGISRDLDLLNEEEEPEEIEAYLQNFVNGLSSGLSTSFQEQLFKYISWTTETDVEYMQGVQSVYRDTDTDELILNVDLCSNDIEEDNNNQQGGISFDVRNDIPAFEWAQPINLTSQSVRMLVSFPEELIGQEDIPNGAKMFVKDINGKIQVGAWQNINEADKWHMIEITPTFGSISGGFTEEGFDASQIVEIGLYVATQDGSNTDFEGQVRVKFLPGDGDTSVGDVVDMPLWMDIRGIKEYLVDQNNRIKVPWVNYLPEEYYSYMFNEGSGDVPSADFEVLENANTYWRAQQVFNTDGISGAGWDTLENSLVLDVNMDSNSRQGEAYLDVRYDCYVPDANWQKGQLLDMTTQEIVFQVRLKDGFTSNTDAPLQLEAFAKSITQGEFGEVWDTQYSTKLALDPDSGWITVTLNPVPTEFNQGITTEGFDPTKISAIGIRVLSQSGTYEYNGQLEVKYEINNVVNGLFELGDNGILPSDPVWVNQKNFGDYIIQNEIDLYCDMDILETAEGFKADILDRQLSSDFVAYTVYDSNEKVKEITKPDGTTTFFDSDGSMDYIAFENGDVFIDYEYDENGDLLEATLVSARNELEDTMIEAVLEIERKTTDTLLVLAEQGELLAEDFIEDEINPNRAIFAAKRDELNSQLYIRVKHNFCGIIYYTKHEQPGVREALRQLAQQEAIFERTVSEQLVKLDQAIQDEKDKIEAEKNAILGEYEWQKKRIYLSILREEAIPIFHYYYRNILGRDADEFDIETIYKQIDESEGFAGFFPEDILDLEAFILSLQQDISSPVFNSFTQDEQDYILNYVEGTEIDDETRGTFLSAMDSVIMQDDLYTQLTEYYSDDETISSALSKIKETDFAELIDIETYESDFSSNNEQRLDDIQDVKDQIAYRSSLQEELINIVNDPNFNFYSYYGYWREFLAPYYDVFTPKTGFDLIIRDGILYEKSLITENPITGFLDSITIDLPGYTNNMESDSITISGDLADTSTAVQAITEYETYFNAYVESEFERIKKNKQTHIFWINRYALQSLYPEIREKNKDTTEFNAETLKQELLNRDEYAVASAFKENVSASIMSFIEQYFDNPGSRDSLLAELGLTEDEVINVSDKFIVALNSWLSKQDMHFGISAFGSVYRYLEDNGVILSGEEDKREIAKKALLIDILTGTSGPMNDEKIAISMYAVNKVADLYGVSSTNARLVYEDLMLINNPFVTLINQRHYITVLSVTDANVTYWDQNIGANGQEITITREEFENNWQGNVTVRDENISLLRAEHGADAVTVLSVEESKKLKGAFFWFIPFILGAIFKAVVAVVTVAIQVITVVMEPLLTFVGNIASGLVNAIANVGNIFGAIGKSFIGAMGGTASAASTGAVTAGVEGSGAVLSSLVSGFSSTVMQIGVGYGVSTGLDALGVDPLVSGLISNIVTGGSMGLLSGGGMSGFFRSALMYGSSYGVELLGQHLDLDPMITGILSTATAALMGAGISEMTDPEFSFKDSLKYIAKNVGWELVGYGVQYAGMELGVDPTVSYLAGIAIRSSLRAGFSDGQDPGELIGTALLQGVTSVGLNYLVEKMDVNPLLANIGFSAIAGAIEGAISGEGIFEHMFEMYEKNALAFFGGGTSTDPWQQAAYIAQIQDFTQIARERGFVEALNTYATGFFNSTAVNSIVTTGLTIGDYFKNKWDAGQTEQITLKDGQTVDGVRAENTESILLFDSEGNVIGLKEGENLIFGDIGVDGQGKMALLNGYIAGEYLPGEYIPSLGITMDIENGYASNARIIDPITGDTLYWLYPKSDGGYLGFDNLEMLNDFRIQKVANTEVDFDISFDGDIYEVRDKMYFDELSEENQSRLISLGLTDVDSLGYFAYELTPEEQLSKVAFSMELNDDIKNFITLYPELAPEVLDVFMEETIKVPYYDVLNKEGMKALTADYCGDRKIDLSEFRNYSQIENAMLEKYGSQKALEFMTTIGELSNRIDDLNLIGVTANLLVGSKVQVYTDDGMLLEVSGYAGEHFKSEESWQFFDEDKKLVDVEFNIKNGTDVEASISKKMLHSFVETSISLSGETSSKAGTYQLFSNVNLETTTSQFYGTNEHGAYIGNAFGELSVAGHQLTKNETLLYVDEEVLSGERVPVNNNEIYGKLVYDILNNEKDVITQTEYILLQEKSLEFTSKAFEGVEGVTVDDIAQLADAQVNKLSSIVSTGDFEITGISQDTVYNIYERLLLSEGIQGVNSATE